LKLQKNCFWDSLPLIEGMAAVSVCDINGQLLLDPNYHEDSQAAMDGNFVLTESGKILEIQMTAEDKPYDANKLADLLKLAQKGVKEIIELQNQAMGSRP